MVDTNSVLSPNPCPPPDATSLPVYDLTGDGSTFLVDATGGQVATDGNNPFKMLWRRLLAVNNLISQVQTALAPRTMARAFGMAAAMDSVSDLSHWRCLFDTNQLWLEITNYDSNFAYLNLHNGTDFVYCVWSSTNLSGGWQVESELFPAGERTNVLPFTVQNLNRQDLFLRAKDWTGVTYNGNQTPDWWFWEYFGRTPRATLSLKSAFPHVCPAVGNSHIV